jgi:tetratricopeptide (TPR) repeat protein
MDDLRLYLQTLKIGGLFIKGEKESNKLAQKELIDLIDLYPNNAVLNTFLGYTYILELWFGTCDNPIVCIGKATEAVRKALSLDDSNSDAQVFSGIIFLMRKEHDKAIAAVKHALKLNPNNADGYSMLGYILYQSDRPSKAIEFCNKAIRLNPIPPTFYYCFLGHAYRLAELYEKAIKSYKKSLEIEPYIFSYIGLAASYSLLGRENEAYEAGLEVRKINPEFSLAKFDKISPQKNKSKQQIYINALRKAGLPE